MKKKKLKKRIKDLQQLTDCLISDNVRLLMRLGEIKYNYDDVEIPKFGTCTQEDAKGTILERTKEPEPKEQNDKRSEQYQTKTGDYVEKVVDAMGRIHEEFNKPKTEGPESESELKENTISLYVGKKYEAKNKEILECIDYDETAISRQRYELRSRHGIMFYSKEGIVCVDNRAWDIVSEGKE